MLITSFSTVAYAEDAQPHILQNLAYFEDQVEDVKDGESWVAIVETNGGYTAKKVVISVKTVKDENAPGGGPYKKVSSDPQAIFLVKGIAIKDDAQIKSYPFDMSAIETGTSIDIKGDKATITLVAKSRYVKSEGWEHETYQLTGKVNNKEFNIIEPTSLNDVVPHLIWAGDLNNDGYPDLLIDTTEHYSASVPTLFLSKVDKNEVTYNKVAERLHGGC